MLRVTSVGLAATHWNYKYRMAWSKHKYNQFSKWQREAMGANKWEHTPSRRPRQPRTRYNAENAALTKGTSGFAWKWHWHQQRFLPRTPPEGYKTPMPIGREAWPVTWEEDFGTAVTSMTESELREAMIRQLAQIVFEETQRDGYEVRRLDFEGKPITELPTRDVVEGFVMHEDTLRERIVRRLAEDIYRIPMTSDQFAEMTSVRNLIEFLVLRIRQCRNKPAPRTVPPAVLELLSKEPVQPRFGFAFALPNDDRPSIAKGWEKLFHHEWQFGNAVYRPRKVENVRGNLTWLRLEAEQRDRDAFQALVASGEAKRRHLEMIAQATA